MTELAQRGEQNCVLCVRPAVWRAVAYVALPRPVHVCVRARNHLSRSRQQPGTANQQAITAHTADADRALWAATRAVALAVRLRQRKGGVGVGWSWLIMSRCIWFRSRLE